MTSKSARTWLIGGLVILIGALIAVAGSYNGQKVGAIPIFALLVAIAFVIQWLGYAHSYTKQTDVYYDLTGSFTYTTMTVLALILVDGHDTRVWMLAVAVLAWTLRLGSFLFIRVKKSGGDSRFVDILKNPARLFVTWSLQGLWVVFTALAAWIGITSANREPMNWISILGFTMWIVGFLIELVADIQKTQFNKDPLNKGEFIRTGIWSRSRHPNYFGEIVMWTGVLIVAAPALVGWQWIAILSPVFITVLLTKISGVPMLEKKADSRWGERADYQEYKKNTPVLIPKLTA